MKKPLPPCKDCPDKELGCHDRCPVYQMFRCKLADYNKMVKEERIKNRRLEDAQWTAYYQHHKGTLRG